MWCLTFSAIAAGEAVAADGDAPLPTASDVASTMRSALAEVKSIYISYAISTTVLSDLVPTMTKGAGKYEEAEEFALTEGKLFRRRTYWDVSPKGERVRRNELRLVFDGTRTGEQTIAIVAPDPPVTEPATIIVGKNDGKFYGENVYLDAIGAFWYDGRWLGPWVIEAVAEPPVRFSLPDALDDNHYRVASTTERVGDADCIVLVRDHWDKLWLDRARGFAVVKREWQWSDSDALMFRFLCSKLAERSPGLWLPGRVVCELWVKPVDGRWTQNVHLKTSTCDVVKLTMNQAPADLFDIAFPRGTEIIDASVSEKGKQGHPIVEYEAGVSPEDTQANLDVSLRRSKELQSRESFRRKFNWVNVAICAAVCAVLVAVLRRRRRASPR